MAIAYDNSLSQRVLDGNSYAYTSAANTKMYMVTQSNVSAVTYGGVSLTSLRSFTPSINDGNEVSVILWGLSNPASGANNFVFTCGAQPSVYAVATYTGCIFTPEVYNDEWSHTTSPAANTQVGTWTSNVTTVTDNAWSIMFIVGGNNSPRTFTAGASTTLRATGSGQLDTLSLALLDSNGAITPAGATTLKADWSSGSGFVSSITVSLAIQSPVNGNFIPFL